MNPSVMQAINTLSAFLGPRDASSVAALPHADVMVLFGGSILAGGDEFAEAIRLKKADTFIIVGGAGHTTEALREKIRAECPSADTRGMSEAEAFSAYISEKYGVRADLLETKSSNCGNNITLMLDVLEKNNVRCESIILMQDASMQRRMTAGLRKHRPEMHILNYAAYRARVTGGKNGPVFEEDIHGMWDMERYISLLLGEIPRLRDDAEGYGPNGKGFIAHEEIPADAEEAFRLLSTEYAGLVRQANPAYATKTPGRLIDKIAFLYLRDGCLLSTRSRGKDAWYIPGGKREGGESDLETLVREVREELDIDILPETAALYGVFEAQAHGKAEGITVRMTCYTAQFTGTPVPSSEIEEMRWSDTRDMEEISPVDRLIYADLKEKGLLK